MKIIEGKMLSFSVCCEDCGGGGGCGGNGWRVEMPLRKGDSAWRPLQLPVERP